MDARTVALVAVVAVAPLAVILLVALVRGYRIDLHLDRDGRHRRDRGDGDDTPKNRNP